MAFVRTTITVLIVIMIWVIVVMAQVLQNVVHVNVMNETSIILDKIVKTHQSQSVFLKIFDDKIEILFSELQHGGNFVRTI